MKIVNFTHAQTAETRRSFCLSVNAGYEANMHHDSEKSQAIHSFVTALGLLKKKKKRKKMNKMRGQRYQQLTT